MCLSQTTQILTFLHLFSSPLIFTYIDLFFLFCFKQGLFLIPPATTKSSLCSSMFFPSIQLFLSRPIIPYSFLLSVSTLFASFLPVFHSILPFNFSGFVCFKMRLIFHSLSVLCQNVFFLLFLRFLLL